MNRSAIFAAAWKAKRNHTFGSFGYWLRLAWYDAKLARDAAAWQAERDARPVFVASVKTLTPEVAAHVAELRASLVVMDYSSRIDWDRKRDIGAEIERLTA